MLRITVRDGTVPGEGPVCLFLEGRIIGPWVSELETVWITTRQRFGTKTPIQVELDSVSYISWPGARLLWKMHSEGAELTASTPLTRTYIEEIRGLATGRRVAIRLPPEYNGGSSQGVGMKRKLDSEGNHVSKQQTEPSHEDIAARAYEIWIEAGKGDGKHESHWLEAKKELSSKSKKGILG